MKGLLLTILLAAIVFSANIWGTSIYILDEAKNASCAMEMLQRKNFIVPFFNNQLRTDKPPLHYYCMIAGYLLFGVNPFAARIFSALAGVLTVWLAYSVVKKQINGRVAAFTVMFMLASLQLTVHFHMAVPDPYLILWMTLSGFALYACLQGKKHAYIVFYLAVALGFLTKGLIAVVIPVLTAALYALLTRSVKQSLRSLRLGKGILIFSVVALPWYIAVGLETEGEWLKGFFLEHHINRYTSVMEGHRGYFFAPFLFLFFSLFPFSVFAAQAFGLAFRSLSSHPFVCFCSLWVMVLTVFFAFSKTLLPGYVGPAIPFFAVVLGNYLSQWVESFALKINYWPIGLAVVLSLAIPVAAYFMLIHDAQGRLMVNYVWFLLIIPAGVLTGVYYYVKGQLSKMCYAWCGSWMVLTLIFFYIIYPALDRLNPVLDSRTIRQHYAGHRVMSYGLFNPAFVFEYGRPLHEVAVRHENGKIRFPEHEKLLIITRFDYVQNVVTDSIGFRIIYRNRDLFEQSETVILAN